VNDEGNAAKCTTRGSADVDVDTTMML